MVLRTYLIGKVHGVRLTDKHIDYQGSITLSREYLQAAGIGTHEAVQVVNLSTGDRLWTYVLVTDEPKTCILNGGAARCGEVGDPLIIMAFAQSDRPLTPRVVVVGADNGIQQVLSNEAG
jgi:aspartate 1-decarboxylase